MVRESVRPPPQPRRLLTVADYVALGEDRDGARQELQEGNPIMCPGPGPEHEIAVLALDRQLDGHLPDSVQLVPDADQFGYLDAGPASGTFSTTEPFPVRIDLDRLV